MDKGHDSRKNSGDSSLSSKAGFTEPHFKARGQGGPSLLPNKREAEFTRLAGTYDKRQAFEEGYEGKGLTYGFAAERRVTPSLRQPQGQEGSEKVFRKPFQRVAVCPARHRHRQAEELQCGKGPSAAQHRALAAEVSKQPAREFASAD